MSDNDWTEAIHNLWRVLQRWALLSWVLGKKGEYARKSGIFYTRVVQEVLLYGPE